MRTICCLSSAEPIVTTTGLLYHCTVFSGSHKTIQRANFVLHHSSESCQDERNKGRLFVLTVLDLEPF